MRTTRLKTKGMAATNLKWLDEERPKNRKECKDGPRPCPWVMCRHHLYLEVNPITGNIRLNFPSKEVWELEQTCSLDVADLGFNTLKAVGRVFDFSRERVRQLEALGLFALKERLGLLGLLND